MQISYAVCFDLHHTLLSPEFDIRPGVKELFQKLGKEGKAIILTTTGEGPHIQEVLASTQLKQYFAFEFEASGVGNGKLYKPASDRLGFSPAEAPHRLIATGDLLSDQPADIPIVFIHHPGGYKYHASLLDHLITHLLKEGEGSFLDGFNKTLKDRKKRLDGISVTVSYLDPRENVGNLPLFSPGIRIPTIRVIDAEKYLTKTP